MRPDKPAIVAALRAALSDELGALERVAAMSRDEAGSEETKSEGKYDTRATEASYLARGLAMRIAELRQIVAWFEVFDAERPMDPPVAQTGALLRLEGAPDELLFLAPVGGGRVSVAGLTVKIISPSSPLGAALAELEAGDAAEVETPRGQVTREILEIW